MQETETYPLIELRDVAMRWEGHTVLRDVNLTVNKGDFLAITGPNGGGKSTLLRIILKLLRPTEGSVTYFDPEYNPVKSLPIGYLPQKNMIDSHFPITVSEVIEMGLIADRSLGREERRAKVHEMTALVGLESHASQSLGNLSGGQMQRALLGRALISRPELLVLDEPLSYVDRHFEERIYEIIRKLPQNTTIILVSHDMSTIAAMANRHIIVNHTLEVCHSPNHFAHYHCCDHPAHHMARQSDEKP